MPPPKSELFAKYAVKFDPSFGIGKGEMMILYYGNPNPCVVAYIMVGGRFEL